MKSTLLSAVFMLVLTTFLTQDKVFAQEKNWKTLQAEAQNFEKSGDYSRAAAYYELAFNDNTSKAELAYKAGECFLKVRDYKNAAKNLDFVKNENSKDMSMAGFMYASALKQNTNYELAKKAFNAFISTYNGTDKETLKLKVDTEIKGCAYAESAASSADKSISFVHLSPTVNTERDESAALPFSGKVYFSSNISGSTKLYSTQKIGDTWSVKKNVDADNNPAGDDFQGGSFTADGKRYYFSKSLTDEKGTTLSVIFVSEKNNGVWSEPSKLPGFINELTSNNKNPTVVNDKGQEIIYFSSNRAAGKGGYDIWYTSVSVKDGVANYTLPKNVGGTINTSGDEITPYYDAKSGQMYYSSNGGVNMGGFDVFKIKGSKTLWESAKNLGMPVNSSADDYFYILDRVEGGGYMVSNRIFENEQLTTTNDDIYYFEERQIKMTVKGQIFDASNRTESSFKNLNIKVYTLLKDKKELIQEIKPDASEYKVVMNADKNYLIVITADGYSQFSFEQNAQGMMQDDIRVNDILLQKIGSDDNANADIDAKTDPYYIIVPQEYNSPEKTYKLPLKPVDARTGNEVKKGTYAYFAFVEADIIAKKASERKVFWNQAGVLTSFVQGKTTTKPKTNTSNTVSSTEKNTTVTSNSTTNSTTNTASNTTANTTTTTSGNNKSSMVYTDASTLKLKHFVVRVAAVRNFQIERFKQLQASKLSNCEVVIEKSEDNLTRVFLVPVEPNSDGTRGFKQKSDLTNILNYVKNKTTFKDAYVVEK